MQVFPGFSSPANHPTAAAMVGSGFLMTGGGADDQWSVWGNMLTASYPYASNIWKVAGKDHRQAESCSIVAYAIGIENISYPTVGYLQVGFNTYSAHGTGAVPVTINTTAGWALTCAGGWLDNSGYGRMIECDYPTTFTNYAKLVSKDQTYLSDCPTWLYAMRLQKAR